MQKIGTYDLKTHLSEVLATVEGGQTVVITRHGRPIARISPDLMGKREQTRHEVKSLLNFRRTRLPKGVTIRTLIEEGRR